MHPILFPPSSHATYVGLLVLIICRGTSGATFTLINQCEFTVWPGILANAGSSPLESTGFELGPGASRVLRSSVSWSGRFWGRTGCSLDPATGQGSCLTGDCRSGQVECNGAGAQPPATLAEFTVGSSSGTGQDFYDVSLVDGYNLPLVVDASGGSGSCLSTGCVMDLNRACPAELRESSGEACKSACEAFGSPQYCCSGAYATPDTCKPSVYSEMFKVACPRSYSYAYDDATSTFTCTGADYTITFCPTLSASQKSATTNASSTAGATAAAGGSETSSGYTPSSDESHPMYPWLPSSAAGDAPRTTLSTDHDSLLLCICVFCISYLFLLRS